MMLPMSLAADSERVVVYDGMDGSFTAYAASTGAVQWRVGRRGKGPDEYSSYVTLASTPGGDFLALDWQNLRLTYIGPSTGATRRVVRWRVLSAPRYACVTADDRLLTLSSRSGGKPPLIWLADTVATMEAPLPWPDAREAHYLATQSALAAGPRGECVLALKYGRGFARYNRQDSLPLYARDYVEPVPLATLTREKAPQGGTFTRFAKGTVGAANAAAVGEEEILVAFGGRSKFRGRLVDRYALADGDYLGSYLLPFSPDGIAVRAGRIFVIDTSDDYPAVRAFAVP
ncbi:MAG: PQQ-binding-like beta-propeller repeat protein [Gemmatimonadaceae bacterium]